MRLAGETRAEYDARMRRFAEWKRALLEGTEAERIATAREGFPELAALSCEPLRRALEDPNQEVRLAAVATLRSVGTSGVVRILNDLLQSPCLETRMAAADALGRVGDERSVEPLRGALNQLTFGSPWKQVLVTLALFGVPWFQVAVLLSGGSKPMHWITPALLLACVIVELRTRKSRLEPLRRYTDALKQIAERHPKVDLREVERNLRAASRNVFLQARETRVACREAVSAIEGVRALPIASEASPIAASQLPVVRE